MNAKLMLSVLLVGGWSVSALASEDPANTTLLKQCESAQGEVKEECQEVAKQIIRKDTSTQDRDDNKASPHVTHSSPAMNTPADREKQREVAEKDRKAKEKKDAAAQKSTEPTPDPAK